MSHYQVIKDEKILDEFVNTLSANEPDEVYYLCLFGRHKYCPEFPNTRDSGQLVRVIAKKEEIKSKLRRMECPLGSYERNGVAAPQNALAAYMGLNPRSLRKANQNLIVEFARRFSTGEIDFNPITLANTQLHKANCRKFYVDFDFDNVNFDDYKDIFVNMLPIGSYRILNTRGGFHLIAEIAKMKKHDNWYNKISQLPNCDVKGSNNLTPIPGCVQGDFVPYFME